MRCKLISLIGDKSLNDLFREENVYYEKDFLIPCKSYDTILKYIENNENNNELNIFEETILKILSIKKFGLEYISKKMALDINFVEYLCVVLIEKEYLSQNLEITQKGIDYVGGNISKNENIKKDCVSIFQEKITNTLLPYKLHGKTYIEGEFENDNKLKVVFKLGNSGNEKNIKIEVIDTNKNKEIIKINQKKIEKSLKKNNCLESIKYLKEDNAELNFIEGEDIYFHIKSYVLKDNTEKVFFTDGRQKIIDLKYEHIQNRFRKMIQQNNEIKDNYKEINKKYKNIRKCIISKDDNLENSLDKREKKFEEIQSQFECLYANFEWSLYYYLREKLNNSKLKAYIQSDNHGIIKEVIEKYLNDKGQDLLFISEKNKKEEKKVEHLYSSFSKGKFDSIYEYNSDPNLKTLFPIILLEATMNISNPINEILHENKEFIKDIYKFNELRNENFHTTDIKNKIKIENKKEDGEIKEKEILFIDYLKDCINKLQYINKKILDIDVEYNDICSNNDYSRYKNNAIFIVTNNYPLLYSTLSEGMKNILLKLVDDDTLMIDKTNLDIINMLSKFIENYLHLRIKNLDKKNINLENVIEYISNRINKVIPKELKGTKKNNINNAFKGGKSTLQGLILAYYTLEDKELLINLEDKYDLLNVINYIASKRNHGTNHLSLMNINENEIKRYKKVILDVINEINNY